MQFCSSAMYTAKSLLHRHGEIYAVKMLYSNGATRANLGLLYVLTRTVYKLKTDNVQNNEMSEIRRDLCVFGSTEGGGGLLSNSSSDTFNYILITFLTSGGAATTGQIPKGGRFSK